MSIEWLQYAKFVDTYNSFTWDLLHGICRAAPKSQKDLVAFVETKNVNIFFLKFMITSLLNLQLASLDEGDDVRTLKVCKQLLAANYASMKSPVNVFAIFEQGLRQLVFSPTTWQLAVIKAPPEASRDLLDFFYDFTWAYFCVLNK